MLTKKITKNSHYCRRANTPQRTIAHGQLSSSASRLLVKERAPGLFRSGFDKLGLDPHRLPDINVMSERLRTLTGWTLVNAKDEYLQPGDWFASFSRGQFPVTDYIRPFAELSYTPLPDLFHEYFGHLAFFADQKFADLAGSFGMACRGANARQLLEISRLWWYSAEFGIVREKGVLKALGAGLLSSPGEFAHAFSGTPDLKAFSVDAVVRTAGSPHTFHSTYFVIESIDAIAEHLREYATGESLAFASR